MFRSHWRISLRENPIHFSVLPEEVYNEASRWSDQCPAGLRINLWLLPPLVVVPLNQFYIQIKSYEVLTVNFNLYDSFSFVKGGRVEPIIMSSIHTDRSANMHWPLRSHYAALSLLWLIRGRVWSVLMITHLMFPVMATQLPTFSRSRSLNNLV